MTDHINQRILDEIKDNKGNLSKTARSLGLSMEYLKTRFGSDTVEVTAWPQEAEPTEISSLGRNGFRKYVIAVKRRMSIAGWPEKYREIIEDARAKFDAGTHDMYTGHIRGWAVLYLIPRRTPVAPTRFFGGMNDVA